MRRNRAIFGLSPEWVTLIGAIIAVVGTLIAAIGVWRGSQEQAALSQSLLSQSEEIAEVNRTIVGSVTGGTSFGYLQPNPHPSGEIGYFLRINPDAKYPVFDVTVRLYDMEPPYRNPTGAHFYGPESFGTLTGANQWLYVFGSGLPTGAGARARAVRVEIAARNGVLVQELRLVPKDGEWLTNSWRMLWNGEPVAVPRDFPQEKLR